MAKTTPKIPKGTRDLLPIEAMRREYIFATLKGIFQKYGFGPIETPAYELLETLTGKYGDEGDKLMFKVLPRGRKLDSALKAYEASPDNGFEVEEALRYDLTVPFARFVVQHQNDLTFPFKRYQIQPVWRADRPQKGRYREFFQCDVDVIGSDSLWNEVELVKILFEGFSALSLGDIVIKLNNRKVLFGVAEVLGETERFQQLTIAFDKFDKVGASGVLDELRNSGFEEQTLQSISPLLNDGLSLEAMKPFLANSEIGQKGLDELQFVLDKLTDEERKNVIFDATLARGLNYYTGAIIEVVHKDFPSSIAGGGRYDDLTGVFGLQGMSGVGVSFGADRIYDLMLEKSAFPSHVKVATEVLFLNFGDTEASYAYTVMQELRKAGVSCELYPDAAKIKKQFKYADNKGVRFVALIGDSEMNDQTITLKDMDSGNQETLSVTEALQKIH